MVIFLYRFSLYSGFTNGSAQANARPSFIQSKYYINDYIISIKIERLFRVSKKITIFLLSLSLVFKPLWFTCHNKLQVYSLIFLPRQALLSQMMHSCNLKYHIPAFKEMKPLKVAIFTILVSFQEPKSNHIHFFTTPKILTTSIVPKVTNYTSKCGKLHAL